MLQLDLLLSTIHFEQYDASSLRDHLVRGSVRSYSSYSSQYSQDYLNELFQDEGVLYLHISLKNIKLLGNWIRIAEGGGGSKFFE